MVNDLNMTIFKWIHANAGNRPVVDRVAVLFAEGGPWMLAALFVVLWFFVHKNKKISLLEASGAAVIGLIINQIITFFYFHPRPYMEGLCTPLFPHVPEISFPSDHATLLFAAVFYLLMGRRWILCGIPLLIVATTTAWGRVYCGIHFPLDMVGSIVVAFISAWLMSLSAGRLRPFNAKIILLSDAITGRIGIFFRIDKK